MAFLAHGKDTYRFNPTNVDAAGLAVAQDDEPEIDKREMNVQLLSVIGIIIGNVLFVACHSLIRDSCRIESASCATCACDVKPPFGRLCTLMSYQSCSLSQVSRQR